jgi:CIC family chloride channel protein
VQPTWQRFRRALRRRGAAAFLAASLAVGILVGLASALLFLLVEWIGDFTLDIVDRHGDWVFAISVPLGVFFAWLIARRVAPEVESGGVTETMVGLSLHGGYLPTRTIVPKIAVTAVTLGSGGSGGREGPAVMIGGAIGSSIARYTRLGEDQIRSLIAAGAGAGIGAAFNAPIAGMLFALEVLLQNFSIRHLNAVVIASVAAAVTTQQIVGEEQILTAPPHELGHPAELVLYVLLGLAAVAFGLMFLRILDAVAQARSRATFPDWVRPLLMGGIVGLIGIVESDALGTGQDFVAGLLRLTTEGDRTWWALLLLAVAKMVTNTLTRAGGGSAGTFMPSLFVGASVGAALAIVVEPVWSFSEIEPGAFAVVGMAAAFASVGRAPLTSILIVFEITGNYGLVLPLMLATSVATFLTDRFHPASAYTMPLVRRGIHLIKREDIDLLDTITVGEVMKWPGTVLSPAMSTAQADALLEEQRHHGMPVTADDELVGIITVSDIARAGGPSETTTVGTVMTGRPITVVPSMPVSAALARMAALGFGRLPVVSEDDPTQLVGMFRRDSVVRAYHHALGATTGRHLYRDRIRQRTDPGAAFYEVPVPHASPISGKRVRDLVWPEGATLVSIRRDVRVIIPHGNTVLESDDVITAFGTGDSRVELAFVLQGQSLDHLEEDAT